jgi:hypothetical protein
MDKNFLNKKAAKAIGVPLSGPASDMTRGVGGGSTENPSGRRDAGK